MKNANFQIRNDYYNSLSKSHHSSQTFRRIKSSLKSDNLNDTKTKFFNRIDKACPTMSQDHINKEVRLCRREIERLNMQILKRDKIILEMRSSSTQMKEIDAELIEVYRIVYMYEGKMKEYEKELKRLQIFVAGGSSKDMQSKIQELLQSYRVQNCELQGNLELKGRMIWELQEKFKKIQAKYVNTRWKLSTTRREGANPLKRQFPNLRNMININQPSLLQKEKELNNKMKLVTAATKQYELAQINQSNTSNQLPPHIQQPKLEQQRRELMLENANLQTGSFPIRFGITPNNGYDSFSKIESNPKIEKEKDVLKVNSQKKIYYSSIKRHQLKRNSDQVLPGSSSSQDYFIVPADIKSLKQ